MDADSLKQHMEQYHSGQFLEEKMRDLVLSSQQQRNPTLDKCPVCSLHELSWRSAKTNDSTYELSTNNFLEHIGGCLHTFSLRALPATENDDDNVISSGAFAARSSISDQSKIITDTLSEEQEPSGSSGLTEADLQRAFIDTISFGDRVSVWNLEPPSEVPPASSDQSLNTTPVSILTMPKAVSPSADIILQSPTSFESTKSARAEQYYPHKTRMGNGNQQICRELISLWQQALLVLCGCVMGGKSRDWTTTNF